MLPPEHTMAEAPPWLMPPPLWHSSPKHPCNQAAGPTARAVHKSRQMRRLVGKARGLGLGSTFGSPQVR
eukprot:15140347-Alexandrium_andersonii.AAC.1